MKKAPALFSALAIILISLTSFLLFIYFLKGFIIYNGMGGFVINSEWFSFNISFGSLLDRYYYISLIFFIIFNLIWVCVVPYIIGQNRSSMRRMYWFGLIVNMLLGLLTSPFLVWLPFGLDILSFLILLGLSLLMSVGAYMISSLTVAKGIKAWWRP